LGVTSAAVRICTARKGLETTEVDDGYVIYDEINAKVLFLNPTAAAVLELCDGVSDLRSIASTLQSEFDLPHAPEADVAACLEALLSQGLVTDCSPSSSAA
jgi:PqqD family protein of HPr-rel-A system